MFEDYKSHKHPLKTRINLIATMVIRVFASTIRETLKQEGSGIVCQRIHQTMPFIYNIFDVWAKNKCGICTFQ